MEMCRENFPSKEHLKNFPQQLRVLYNNAQAEWRTLELKNARAEGLAGEAAGV